MRLVFLLGIDSLSAAYSCEEGGGNEMDPKEHELTLRDRKELTLSGVKHVISYDEKEITLDTTMGGLVLKGERLNVRQLDLEDGKLLVSGETFISLIYGNVEGKGKGVWQRLWK